MVTKPHSVIAETFYSTAALVMINFDLELIFTSMVFIESLFLVID